MKFAKQIYVKIERDNDDSTYLLADTDMDGMVETGEKVKVGVYKLERVVEVSGVVKIKP